MMIERRLLFSGLTVAAFIAVMGCHSSTTPPQTAPAASPASAVPAQKPPAPPPPVETAKAPPTPIHVRPPASFSPEQIPQDGPVVFSIRGNAGDLLVVKVKEDIAHDTRPHMTLGPGIVMPRPGIVPQASYSVSIRLPASNGLSVEAVKDVGTCDDMTVYLFPQTGTYQVALDQSQGLKWGRKYAIGFTLLAESDLIMDPGIKPEQVLIDFGALAKGKQIKVVPAALTAQCDAGAWPSHLAAWTAPISFQIMRVAGYKKVQLSDSGMTILEAALATGRTDSVGRLPYASSGDAGLEMWARQEILEGDGWRGLRWIGGYGQDPGCGSDLRYVFEGISNDGRFLIVGGADIAHPAKQKRWAPRGCVSEAEVPKINALLAHDLTAADPASFQPNLNQLDAVVRSIKLKY
ncbi:MAG TPA: hypothetical protein VN176_12970 [Verrucomicrobiae bacterium]|jgi:hypothetical protein|nr:hypothetical protein [Verrucomicrobiae bacterium]